MMKDTLLKMLKPFGPSGCEEPAARVIADIIRPYVDDVRLDTMGNLIATKRGPGKRIMFSAHMDSIGYIVLDADKEGFLRVSNIGGIRAAQAGGRHIVFGNGKVGVIQDDGSSEKPSMTNLYIDIGATGRDEALEIVPIGTMGVVDFQCTEMGGNLIAAPFMDDRAACAVLAELLMTLPKQPKHEIVAVFSVQEEVGCRGAQVAAFAIEPDIGVAIDVTAEGGIPKCDPPMPMRLNKGPAVKVKDSGSISTPMVRDGLAKAGKAAGVPFQYEVLPYGGTDACTIMTSRGGVPAGTLSIPCRYIHSPVETVSLTDMENCVKLLEAYVEQIVE